MKSAVVILCSLMVVAVHAEQKAIRGKVTYVASGTVYTSLGREKGVQDSTLLFITSNLDTTARLKVFAVSSKSSACWILKSTRPAKIGDDIAGMVEVVEVKKPSPDSGRATTTQSASKPLPNPRALPPVAVQTEYLKVQGRVSAQYLTVLYQNNEYNISQPGFVLNLRGALRDAPLKFDVYTNLRTLSLGKQSPFSSRAVNQSRIYGLSVSYDDGDNLLSVGRIIPVFSPSIGYIDGVLASKKVGNLIVGGTVGYQPDYSLRGMSTEYKKFALFTQYITPDRMSLSVSTAYARTYFHSALDREAASMLVSAAISSDLYLYANSEVDLRKKSGNDFVLSPMLTNAYVNINYRITNAFSVGLGADASRPYYSFQSVRDVPDSLLANDLRSGITFSVNWYLFRGVSLSNTYTPRKSQNESFGSDYSNYSSLGIANVASTGINMRTSVNLHANRYTNATGYGFSLQRTFEQLIDLNLRYQRNSYTVQQTNLRNSSTTLGADMMVFITNSLSFLATYDRLDGYGTISNSVFAELSVRF